MMVETESSNLLVVEAVGTVDLYNVSHLRNRTNLQHKLDTVIYMASDRSGHCRLDCRREVMLQNIATNNI